MTPTIVVYNIHFCSWLSHHEMNSETLGVVSYDSPEFSVLELVWSCVPSILKALRLCSLLPPIRHPAKGFADTVKSVHLY